MIVTKRDRILLRHIEEYDFITLKQAELLAYSHLNYGYDYARNRFKKLINEGFLKVKRSPLINKNIYYLNDKFSNPKVHKILLMDYYCNLISSGASIRYFEKEKEWCNGNIRSDAFSIYELGDTRFYNIVEVNVSHNDLRLERYMNIIDEFHNDFNSNKDILPIIILIDYRDRGIKNVDNTFEVINLKYNDNYVIEEFSKIFI